jgi:hypothetical protein
MAYRIANIPDLYMDVGAANTLASWGYTREGYLEEPLGAPTVAPAAIARSSLQTSYAPGAHWPTLSTYLIAMGPDGEYIDWSVWSVDPRPELAQDMAEYAGIDEPVAVVSAVPQDAYGSTGGPTPGPRSVAIDGIKPAGEFEILTTAFISGAPTKTFTAQGATVFYRRTVTTSTEFLDAMLGVSETVDHSTLFRPVGQTSLYVTTP